jgi:hypothetical protein
MRLSWLLAGAVFACCLLQLSVTARVAAASSQADSARPPAPDSLAADRAFDPEAHGLPKLVEAEYIEVAKIASISKFRSAAGHDYSDRFESCRSMKHYFKPFEELDWSNVKISSPVQGVVLRTEDEWAGTRIEIQAAACPAFTFTIFHVKLRPGLRPGDKVAAGQALGFHIGHQTCSDIAVAINTPKGRKLVSYFDVMPERLFADYRLRGVNSRTMLIISKQSRDAEPLTCRNGKFLSGRRGQDWIALGRADSVEPRMNTNERQ